MANAFCYSSSSFSGVQKARIPPLTSTSKPPPLFDGTTRLYISYLCPYAQRVWITRDYKGLQDKIELVPFDLPNRPAWYKEKVYPENKVPSLEHNGKGLGRKSQFDEIHRGQLRRSITGSCPRKNLVEQLISYVDTFSKELYSLKADPIQQTSPAFDYLENCLGKSDDGPFFLGQFSWVDIAYVPFVERFQLVLFELFKHDITEGRPKLAAWIEEVNKINVYTQTRGDPKEILDLFKKRLLASTVKARTSCSKM